MGKQTVTLNASDFVHLHNHTQYSLLDGLTKVPELMEYVKEQGMNSVAITDHGTLSGLVEFYKAAKEKDINPILGIETYVAARKHTERDPQKDKANYHLILLAKNNKGYENLMRLSSIANLEGFYYKPRVDKQLLKKYSEGIIALSGCLGGELASALQLNNLKEAKEIISWYKGIFKDSYYLELQDHGQENHPTFNKLQHDVNQHLIALSKEMNVPCVVTADAHYLRHADQEAHEVLLCVQTGSYLSDENRMSLKDLELHVTEPAEIIKRWSDIPEAVTNTSKIANQCSVTLPLGKTLIPKFDTPKGDTESVYLKELVYQGCAWRYGKVSRNKAAEMSNELLREKIPKDVLERADYELSVIDSMGFSGYFLIVQDFINWGKDNGIIFGPGRGSAAGSLVSYSLRITEIDPLKYNLMFERFLNPSRVSMPDIDIDIQDTRREEVVSYCVKKYGRDRVANIATFGRMAAKNAVRDVARVLQVPYSEADRLSKMLPNPIMGRHIPLKVTLETNEDVKKEYDENAQSKRVFDLAVQLEGTIRSHGIHAAGVVIAPDEIVLHTPLEMAQKGVVSTQYSMGPIDELGLLKIDFLGLSNLTTIKNTLSIIKKVYKKNIDLLEIPIDDEKTFELLRRADTTGVFQLESAGMKRYLKELRPTVLEDIIAMNALYRPGPMAEIPNFIKGKNYPEKIKYPHQLLEPILKDTYGVLVYQEQITKMLQLIAGYTAGEADLVRKAIGKKNRAILEAEEPKFIQGCMYQGLSEKKAKEIWTLIQPFADYSFPKAHATAYAQISYWTAYLKANYPDALMAALMTTDYNDVDRLAIDIADCNNMGMEVLPPDVNESFVDFGIVPDKRKIRFGLKAIKNVGSASAEEIVRVREETGPYKTLEDFLTRVSYRLVNRKSIESLIKSGGFDSFNERATLLENIDLIVAYSAKIQKDINTNQLGLFSEEDSSIKGSVTAKLDIDSKKEQDIDRSVYIKWERELLGLYLSDHPLKPYMDQINKQFSFKDIKDKKKDDSVRIIALISEIKEITTKNGQKMAFLKLEDLNSSVEAVMFPSIYKAKAESINKDEIVEVVAKVSERGSGESKEKSLIIDDIKEVKALPKLKGPGAMAADMKQEKLYINLPNLDDSKKLITLKRLIDGNPGFTKVILVIGEDKDKRQAIKLPKGFELENEEALTDLRSLMGDTNLVIN